ncbi:MAG: hypothetical protein BMS9Abin29_1159 [Gemmatimonadota bacterium]|nr:MAG: hypothetical protein BMS9Abin29_1159 [Gemmatimonadota bacterium]
MDGSLSRRIAAVLTLVAIPVSLSCGGDGGVAAPTPVATVQVTPAQSTILIGETVQLSGATLDSNGNILTGRAITWSSSDDQIATVSSSGLVTGTGPGGATITATSEGRSGMAQVMVNPVVVSVTLTPAQTQIRVAATVQLTAELRNAAGEVVTGRMVEWSSSNDGIATVDGAGLVTGVALGSVTITATSEGQTGTATVEVIPDAFAPQENTSLSGTQQFATVAIPAGVTVTATGDLTLNVDGHVTIGGTLVGDCVSIEVNGNSTLTVTGTVSNTCSDSGALETPPLTLVGNGAITFDGATVNSRGDITIKNNPALTEADFATPAAAAATGRRSLAQAAARGSAQASACAIMNSNVSNRVAGIAPNGADGTPNGDPGEPGSNVTVFCDGAFTLRSDDINELIAWSGADGGTGTHQDQTAAVARGGLGGGGGRIRLGVAGSLEVNGTASTLLQPGGGGNAGAATATGLEDPSRPKGASATATGLKGGNSGIAKITIGGEIMGSSTLNIVMATPGAGGFARATGARGRNAGTEPAGDGGDATATGGPGGDLPDNVIEAGGFISANIIITPPGTRVFLIPDAVGGSVEVAGGDGGEGNMTFPDGGAGGGMVGQGGQGGSAMVLGADGKLLRDGYNGGGVRFEFGQGWPGWDDCGTGALQRGGNGGRGGDASGGAGKGGTGKAEGPPGDIFLRIGTGDGGDGGDGEPPGSGGIGGTDGIVALGARVEPGPVFQKGKDGTPCKSGTYNVSIGVVSDPANHELFLGGGGMTSVSQIELQLDPAAGTISFAGAFPWTTLTGDRDPVTGAFTATGSETYGGGSYPNVSVTFTGTLTCHNQLSGDLVLSNFPSGQPDASYSLTGSRPAGSQQRTSYSPAQDLQLSSGARGQPSMAAGVGGESAGDGC